MDKLDPPSLMNFDGFQTRTRAATESDTESDKIKTSILLSLSTHHFSTVIDFSSEK